MWKQSMRFLVVKEFDTKAYQAITAQGRKQSEQLFETSHISDCKTVNNPHQSIHVSWDHKLQKRAFLQINNKSALVWSNNCFCVKKKIIIKKIAILRELSLKVHYVTFFLVKNK